MSEYAIIETGSKQYWVEPNSVIQVEKLPEPKTKTKKEISLDKVLLVNTGKKITFGTPTVKGAKVVCDFLGEIKGPKVIHFTYRRRKDSRRKVGHRQTLTELRVKKITVGA